MSDLAWSQQAEFLERASQVTESGFYVLLKPLETLTSQQPQIQLTEVVSNKNPTVRISKILKTLI